MTPLIVLSTLSLLGYHLTFDAEMTTPSDMSEFINTFINGDTRLYQNNEEENYVPYDTTNPAVPFSFTNGALMITASPVAAGDMPYTSGMVETGRIFSQAGGYFEMRASTPAGQGFWPAFWLLPTSYYPEIDILEQPNNSGTDSEYWTHTNSPTDSSGGFSDVGIDLTHGYHSYGFLWTSYSIQYVFDGNLVGWPHDEPPSMVGLPMYMIANLAVGNQWSWPGAPISGASYTLGIDYIRAYSNDPTAPAVSQEPISSPDGANTLAVLTPPTPVTPKTIWSGLDTLVLQMAEDAYDGDAQFTVSIDGKQRGGVQTTTANHALGQTQPFSVKGNFGKAKHTVGITFLNVAYGPTSNRNLYLTGATIDGNVVHNAVLSETEDGTQSFNFCNAELIASTIGTGPDTMLLGISEDRLPTGNARYTITVDGVAQGGIQLASALHGNGQSQTVAVKGTFGPGAHTVGINFINGAAAGSTSSGLNLYVDSLSYNGIAAQGIATELTNKGSVSLPTAVQQPDTVTLNLAEDSWQGDAIAQVSIDGVMQTPVTVTASNAAGVTQQLSYSGSFGGAAVPHTVVVNFTNDAYHAPGEDRNLYVQTLTMDGATVAGQTSIMRGGPVAFSYIPPAPAAAATSAKTAVAKR